MGIELIPTPEPKPTTGKTIFDKVLQDAAQSPVHTSDEWCAMGVCPECIHDMVTCSDGQFCPECGFFTELSYLPPVERDS